METKNKNITTQNKKRATEELERKVGAIRTQRIEKSNSLTLTDGERRIVLDNLLDRADQTSFEATVQFSSGLAGNSCTWSHGPEAPEFVDLLHPWIKPREQRIEAALESITVLGDPATQDLVDDFHYLKDLRQEVGLKLGILLGARLAGYPPEKVKKMAQYLVDTLW